MQKIEWKSRIVGEGERPAIEFTANPSNFRLHPDNQRQALRGSLSDLGWIQRVIVNRTTGNLIDGHARVEEALLLGNDTLVPFTEVELSEDEEALALTLLDPISAEAETSRAKLEMLLHRTSSGNAAVMEFLAKQAEKHGIVPPMGSGGESGEPSDAEPQIDRAAELNEKWKVKSGDLWLIGEHRLLCGDSTKAEDVARVMMAQKTNCVFTSPPYASQRKYDEASGFKPIPPDEYVAWWEAVQSIVKQYLVDDGSFLVNIKEHCEDGQRHLYVKDLTIAHVRAWGWLFVDEFCWRDTKNGVPGGWTNRFKDAWEPVFHFAKTTKIKFNPLANGTESNAVFDYSSDTSKTHTGSGLLGVKATAERDGIARPSNVVECAAASTGGHSAAFPVRLPEFFINAFTDRDDSVYEPFCGSGTTMVAAQNLNRKCYALEISPNYCAVILERMATAFPSLDIRRA